MTLKLLLQPTRIARAIKVRADRNAKRLATIAAGRKRFAGHPLYNLGQVPAGFASRVSPSPPDKALLTRICIAYNKAKEAQKAASASFNVSNEWMPIYEKQLGPVMRALARNDVEALGRMYGNFFRDPCSTGLAGLPVDMNKRYFSGHIGGLFRQLFLIDALHRLELWKRETEGIYPLSVLSSPDIGNPYGMIVDGAFLRLGGADYLHYYASKIASLLPSSPGLSVVEIGGGFGGMAYYLLRDHPKATYIDFDLPETLALASYYLLTAFPDMPAVLFGEAELTSSTLATARIVLMPSFEIEKMPDNSAAVSFNSYSLAEMSPSSITEYVGQIARITKGHFLHINHTKDCVVGADDFGVEAHGLTLLERRVAGWTLGSNPDADEFQFLYAARDGMPLG